MHVAEMRAIVATCLRRIESPTFPNVPPHSDGTAVGGVLGGIFAGDLLSTHCALDETHLRSSVLTVNINRWIGGNKHRSAPSLLYGCPSLRHVGDNVDPHGTIDVGEVALVSNLAA